MEGDRCPAGSQITADRLAGPAPPTGGPVPSSAFEDAEQGWTGPWGRAVQVLIVTYALGLLLFVWLTKDMAVASLRSDPLFAGYSIAVTLYVLSRFALSLFYRPRRDRGHRPTVSIIIPAFNEEAGIYRTIESVLAADYPQQLREVIAVNDGSTDGTWDEMVRARGDFPSIRIVHLGGNFGKRAAMAEGIRRSTGEVLLFVDSDSFLAPDAITAIVAPFDDPKVGAVVGHADVANRMDNWLAKMQQVRYYSAFRVIKSAESVLSGTVTCASGCCSAYRRSAIEPWLEGWEHQVFLGRPATFGDDRALTNIVLRRNRVVYQETARATTEVPTTARRFFKQQLRWKKSWLRESMTVARYFWRKNPVASVLTYASIAFPFMAPFVVLHSVLGRIAQGATGGLWFYLVGTYTMALLYSLYYAFRRRSGLWHHGMTFVAIYMAVLVFQTYYALLTMRDNRWGTRDAEVVHEAPCPSEMTVVEPEVDIRLVPAVGSSR
jgi:hyaluronan synthase